MLCRSYRTFGLLSLIANSIFVSAIPVEGNVRPTPGLLDQRQLGDITQHLLSLDVSQGRKKELVFGDEGSFKLAVFSDLHFGERDGQDWAAWGAEQDINSTRVMNNILEAERPDFVVFNGDQVTGENTFKSNVTRLLEQILSPVKDHSTPFASIYGNHDHAPSVSHTDLFQHEKRHSEHLSYTKKSPESSKDPDGVYNYVLPIYGNEGEPDPVLLLWFFDSRSGAGFSDEEQKEDWVDPQVADWIERTAANFRHRHSALPPSLAFVHIPVGATRQIQSSTVIDRLSYPGINDDVPASHQGESRPDVRDADKPFWTALTETLGEGMLAIVLGHNHGNDWCAKSEETPKTICYARHTGYGGYGNRERGSRIFEFTLRANGEESERLRVKSWIRLEDGTVANGTRLR